MFFTCGVQVKGGKKLWNYGVNFLHNKNLAFERWCVDFLYPLYTLDNYTAIIGHTTPSHTWCSWSTNSWLNLDFFFFFKKFSVLSPIVDRLLLRFKYTYFLDWFYHFPCSVGVLFCSLHNLIRFLWRSLWGSIKFPW